MNLIADILKFIGECLFHEFCGKLDRMVVRAVTFGNVKLREDDPMDELIAGIVGVIVAVLCIGLTIHY